MPTATFSRRVTLVLSGALLAALLGAGCQTPFSEADHRAEVTAYRENREREIREDPNSRISLVHREYLGERKELTFGSGPEADIQLKGDNLAPVHTKIDATFSPPRVHEVHPEWQETAPAPHAKPGDPPEFFSMTELDESNLFWVGRYAILFRPDAPVMGDAIEIYDTGQESIKEFAGLEFYEIDPAYRVQATLIPDDDPKQINLIDSHGSDRPYWILGALRFTLEGRELALEVYSTTLDPAEIREAGLMLIFADKTNGEETYQVGRYLDIEGKTSGQITVDFNLAYSPACNFSPVWTCPFPRLQNRLPVAVRAGEKKYKGKIAVPLKE